MAAARRREGGEQAGGHEAAWRRAIRDQGPGKAAHHGPPANMACWRIKSPWASGERLKVYQTRAPAHGRRRRPDPFRDGAVEPRCTARRRRAPEVGPRLGEAEGSPEVVHRVMCDHVMPLRSGLVEDSSEEGEDVVFSAPPVGLEPGLDAVVERLAMRARTRRGGGRSPR